MKWLRTLILLLICASLPLSGLAASGLAGACPMQQAGSMSMAMDEDAALSTAMPGCDSMQPASTGETSSGAKAKAKGASCKMTVQCQFGSLYHPAVTAGVSRPLALGASIVFHYSHALAIRDPGGVWRPPRLI
jgi:hypothetical protein